MHKQLKEQTMEAMAMMMLGANAIMPHHDGITMLDGWQQSRGARLEKATAEIFNIKEL